KYFIFFSVFRKQPIEPTPVEVQLHSILEFHLKSTLYCHTLLTTHFPLHLAFPRLQCLQIEYNNVMCTECGYTIEYEIGSGGPYPDLHTSNGPECARGLIQPVLPHLPHLRIGAVETKRKTVHGVNRWELSQLK